MLPSLSIKIISKLNDYQSMSIFTKLAKKKFEEYKCSGIVSVLPGYALVQEKYITKNLVMIPQFSNITLISILLRDITFE